MAVSESELTAGTDVGPRGPTTSATGMTRQQRLILVLLLGAQFMLAVDFSILNVALPTVGQGLGFRPSDLQWVATAFALPTAGFTLLFGRIADILGRRRLFMTGMALLVAGSLLGGLSVTPGMLLGARVVQGLATAIATPAALSLLTTSFPEGPLRQRALGLNGALLSGGFTTGAVFGGVLTELLSWRWAFFINAPIGALILVATPTLLKEGRSAAGRLDVPGAATVTGGLLLLVYGITSGGRVGWGSVWTIAPAAVGVVLLVAFWLIESRVANPLAPLPILKRSHVGWGNVGGFFVFAWASSIIFEMTLFMQQVLGYSPLTTGLIFGAMGAGAFVGGNLAPRIMGRVGPKAVLVGGIALQGVSTAGFLLVGDHHGAVPVAVLLIIGIPWGFVQIAAVVAYMVISTSGLPNEEQGLATGLTTMTQQVALTVGIPILSTIATTRTNALRHTMAPVNALVGGIRLAVLVDSVIVVLGALLIGAFLRTTGTTPTPDEAL